LVQKHLKNEKTTKINDPVKKHFSLITYKNCFFLFKKNNKKKKFAFFLKKKNNFQLFLTPFF